MAQKTVNLDFDFAVIGGGLSGVCAALAAARHGLKTVLVHDRSVPGGNSSSECRVWICGATAMGFNRYAAETGIVYELTQENLKRNPEGNPHLWDALLLDKLWSEENITLLLETRMTDVRAEGGKVISVTCSQFCTETEYDIKARVFADCTGDGILALKAGCETVMGNGDLTQDERTRFALDNTYASLGSTIFFYTKKTDKPVKFIAPSFAYTIEEIDDLLTKTGKTLSAADSGCDYWWVEFGGTENTIDDNESIRVRLNKLVYGIWNYIKNSGHYDADKLTLEWVGSMPARRETRRVKARYTLTQDDIFAGTRFEDGVCHGGWPIDTHPSKGIFDAHDSCTQRPVDPYHIPLRSLIANGFDNLLLAGRDVGMNHLAMASARVMKTCAVEGQAAGTYAYYLCKGTPDDMKSLRQTLLRDDIWIPSVQLENKAAGMRISASAPIKPDCSEVYGSLAISDDLYIMLPPFTAGAAVTLTLKAEKAKTVEVTLYESGRPDVYKPNIPVKTQLFELQPGANKVELVFDKATDGNAAIGIKTDAELAIAIAKEPIPGVLAILSKNSLGTEIFCPALSISGMDDIFSCLTLTDGFTRPYGGMRLWASKLENSFCEISSTEGVSAEKAVIYLEGGLYRHYNNLRPLKDPVWDSYMHPALLKDFDVRITTTRGEQTYEFRDNVMRLITLPVNARVLSVRVEPKATYGATYAAVHEIALV